MNSTANAAAYTNIASAQLGDRFKAGLYPNPAKNIVNISIDNPTGSAVYINLFDLKGKKVASFNAGKIGKQILTLPLQQLAAGTYWLEVKTPDESTTLQLIVQQ